MKYPSLNIQAFMAFAALFVTFAMVTARLSEAFSDSQCSDSTECDKLLRKLEIPTVEPLVPVISFILNSFNESAIFLGYITLSDPGTKVPYFGRILLPGLSSNDLSPPLFPCTDRIAW